MFRTQSPVLAPASRVLEFSHSNVTVLLNVPPRVFFFVESVPQASNIV